MTTLTQLEFADDDFEYAKTMARKLGYTQTAYTSGSALIGLFCHPDGPPQDWVVEHGCIIKTAELGFLFVQDEEDLLLR